MRTWMRRAGLGAAVVGLAAVVLMQACQSAGHGKYSDFMREPSPRSVAPGREPGLARSWSPVGVSADSLGLAQAGGAPRVAATEELWVIQRAVEASAPAPGVPGSGALVTKRPGLDGKETQVPVPLKHTDVKASITGYIATVNVKQQFHNPFNTKIEAVYIFPLPENAAVNEFLMTVGERTIRGIIREKEEAKKIYEEARSQGYVASLLTQERPNIFTQSVANIEPGKAIDIDIKYYHTLSYHDGGFDFVFPMVVGPRFNPPGLTDGIGAVGRGDGGSSGQKTQVQYLKPGEPSGHDIALEVEIEAGVSIEKILSKSHTVAVMRDSQDPSKARVKLAAEDSIPNKDFVLRYAVAGDQVKAALLAQADARGNGGYFTLMVVPPADLRSLERSPMEIVFVVDRSGSMNGRPIEQARAAVEHGLKSLLPGDSFQVIDFSEHASTLGSRPLEVTGPNIRQGLAYAGGLDAGGGTMMTTGLRTALDFPHDPRRLRVVSFLTDGFIGNEAEILKELHGRLGAARVFSFGVGSAPNRYLLAEMARLGRGAVAYVGLDDPAAEVMGLFFERISHPAMTDLSVDWGATRVTDVYPKAVPDLFVGRPVLLAGRYEGSWGGTIRVRGQAGGSPREIAITAEAGESAPAGALPAVWARMKIADLSDRELLEGAGAQDEIRRVALEYELMSAYTSFLAVDSMTRTQSEYGITVAQPVHVPEGVRYETAVGGGGAAAAPGVRSGEGRP